MLGNLVMLIVRLVEGYYVLGKPGVDRHIRLFVHSFESWKLSNEKRFNHL